MAVSFRSLFASSLLAFGLLAASGIAADKAADPCSFLTPEEIQDIVGKPVQAGSPKVRRNPAAGADCTYVVGDSGSLNLLIKPRQAGESPERIQAEFAKMDIPATAAPGLGEGAFILSPAPGMTQLHAFTASRHLIITLMVPGLKEDGRKAAVEKLMSIVLSKIQ